MDAARVDADAHVQLGDARHWPHQIDCFDHVKTHLNSATGVIGTRLGKAWHAVVAIAE